MDILLELNYEKYAKFVAYEGRSRIIYVVMSKALYGMLQSSLLYYQKLQKDIEGIRFIVNEYDLCVANRTVEGTQHTICWHVDNLESSHKKKKVNDRFLIWLNNMYGNVKEVTSTRGNRHDYLAMFINYSVEGSVIIDMAYYVKKMIEEFPDKLKDNVVCPWSENLFKVDDQSKLLPEEKWKQFYTFVMKGMFLYKRARQDIQPAIAFLSTRVCAPTEQDYKKLFQMMSFLKNMQDDVMMLEAGNKQVQEWWIDVSFAVHPDMRSHMGAIFTLCKGAISSISTKQKVNTRLSTEAELVGIDDVISKVLWTKRFIEAQGFQLRANIVYRDNTSLMQLEENGRQSASKRTQHFNIKYFYVTDLIIRREMEIKYCRTDLMIADYHTKPLTGISFEKFRNIIMNIEKRSI